MRHMKASVFSTITTAAIFSTLTAAQTFSSCNPLQKSGCPPDPALGRSVNVDFTKGPSDSFTVRGNPTYDSNGVSLTVAKSGDSPLLTSKWYIMFGKVEIVMKAASGAGIVSSAVLQSDTLDEIDWELLGADPAQVQSNYFGKGQTTTYNRGAFHADPGNQSGFKRYTIDWTADQIAWQIDGTTVRTLAAAAAAGQYPQTPMQVKLGAWSGGDPSNELGTIQWARGPTDYSQGPFTMQVKSIAVTDYSTGTQYVYSGSSGTWQSITAVGGTTNSGGSAGSGYVMEAPAVPDTPIGAPQPFGTRQPDTTSVFVKPSVYPWVPESTTLSTSVVTATSYPGLPSGWTVSGEGRVVPPSSAPSTFPGASFTSVPSASCSAFAGDKLQIITTYNQQGFLTTMTVAFATGRPSYDIRGFLISAQAACTAVPSQAAFSEPSLATPAAAHSEAGSLAGYASPAAGTSSLFANGTVPPATALQAQATGGTWKISSVKGMGAACALVGALLL